MREDLVQRLRADHADLQRALARLESTATLAARRRWAARVARDIARHSRLERELLYPAFGESSMLTDDQILFREAEALNAHLESAASALASALPDSEDSYAKANVVRLLLWEHTTGYTERLFERARSTIGRQELVRLQQLWARRRTRLRLPFSSPAASTAAPPRTREPPPHRWRRVASPSPLRPRPARRRAGP